MHCARSLGQTGAEHAMQVLMAWQKVADAMAKGLVGVSLIQQLYKRVRTCPGDGMHRPLLTYCE